MLKSKSEIMREMRRRRKARGLAPLQLWVTAENKENILRNLMSCEQCGSIFLVSEGKQSDDVKAICGQC